MDTKGEKTMYAQMTDKNPYRNPYTSKPEREHESRNPLVRAGMSLVEMVAWLVVMALLAGGMIWLLWNVSR